MYRICTIVSLFFCCYCTSCKSDEIPPQQSPITKEQQLQTNLDSLKKTASNGDLVVRLTDDIISQQVTMLNETDKLYSHAGIITEKQGKKFVYDIGPALPGADTIELVPIDTFLNPDKNIRCALYRYNFSPAEKDSFIKTIEKFKAQDVRFDMLYNLETDEKLYCSEMIYKALKQATNNRIVLREHTTPEKYQKILVTYFKKQGLTKEIIANRKYIPLDHLYLLPDCQELMKFNLKIFPGQ